MPQKESVAIRIFGDRNEFIETETHGFDVSAEVIGSENKFIRHKAFAAPKGVPEDVRRDLIEETRRQILAGARSENDLSAVEAVNRIPRLKSWCIEHGVEIAHLMLTGIGLSIGR